jgi:hypothetical protein
MLKPLGVLLGSFLALTSVANAIQLGPRLPDCDWSACKAVDQVKAQVVEVPKKTFDTAVEILQLVKPANGVQSQSILPTKHCDMGNCLDDIGGYNVQGSPPQSLSKDDFSGCWNLATKNLLGVPDAHPCYDVYKHVLTARNNVKNVLPAGTLLSVGATAIIMYSTGLAGKGGGVGLGVVAEMVVAKQCEVLSNKIQDYGNCLNTSSYSNVPPAVTKTNKNELCKQTDKSIDINEGVEVTNLLRMNGYSDVKEVTNDTFVNAGMKDISKKYRIVRNQFDEECK